MRLEVPTTVYGCALTEWASMTGIDGAGFLLLSLALFSEVKVTSSAAAG
jgi:hypothetical protein